MNPTYSKTQQQAELERLNGYDPNTNPFVNSARQQLRQLPTIPSNGPQFGYPTQQANRVPTIPSPSHQHHYAQPNLYPSVPTGPQFAGYPNTNGMNGYSNNGMNSSMNGGMNSMNSMGGMDAGMNSGMNSMNSINSMNGGMNSMNSMNSMDGGMNSMNNSMNSPMNNPMNNSMNSPMNNPMNNSMNNSMSSMPSQPPPYSATTNSPQYTQQQLQQQAHILQQLQNQQNQQMLALQQQQQEIERKRLEEQAKLQQAQELERKRLEEQQRILKQQEQERKKAEEQKRVQQELEKKRIEEQKRLQLQEQERKKAEDQRKLLERQEAERKRIEEQRRLQQEQERKKAEEQKRQQQELERKKVEEQKRQQQELERRRIEEQKRVQMLQAQEQERKALAEQQREQERIRVEAQQQKLRAEKQKAEQEEAFAKEVARRRQEEERRAFILEQERLLAYQQQQQQLKEKQLADAHLAPPVKQIDPTNPPIRVDQAWREDGYDSGAASLTIYVGEANHLSENTWLATYPYFVIERFDSRNMANIERVFKCPASEGVRVNFSMKCTIRIDDPYAQGFQIRIMHERPKGLPNLCLGLKRFPSFAYFSSSYNAATANPVHKLIGDDQNLTGGTLTLYFQYTNNRASEITGPTNFHYGFGITVNKDGQIVTRNLPKEWKQIFKAAGITPKMFRDPESLKVILQEVNGSLAQVTETEISPSANALADSKDLSSYDGNVAENVDREVQQKALEEQQREAAREQAELEERKRREEEAKHAARERRLAEQAREEEERREREEARARLLSLGQEKGSLTHIEEVIAEPHTPPVTQERPKASNDNVNRLPETNKTQQEEETPNHEANQQQAATNESKPEIPNNESRQTAPSTPQIEELEVVEELVDLVVEESRRAVPVPEPSAVPEPVSESGSNLPPTLPATNDGETEGGQAGQKSTDIDPSPSLPPVQASPLSASSEVAPRFPSGLPTELPAFLSPEDLARAAHDLPTTLPPSHDTQPRFPSGLPSDLPDFSTFVASDGDDMPTTLPKMQTGSYEYYPEPQPEQSAVIDDAEPMKRGYSKAPPKLRAIPQESTTTINALSTNANTNNTNTNSSTNTNTNAQVEPRAGPVDGGITADAILRSKSCLKPVALTLPSIKQLNQQQAGNLASVLSSALAQRRVAMLQSDGAKEPDDDEWSDDSRDD